MEDLKELINFFLGFMPWILFLFFFRANIRQSGKTDHPRSFGQFDIWFQGITQRLSPSMGNFDFLYRVRDHCRLYEMDVHCEKHGDHFERISRFCGLVDDYYREAFYSAICQG